MRIRKNMTVKLGRGTFRVTGAEAQGGRTLVRLTRLTGRGPRVVMAWSDDLEQA